MNDKEKTDYKIYIFRADGTAQKGSDYEEGKTYPLNILIKQSIDTEADCDKAKACAEAHKFDITLIKSGILSQERVRKRKKGDVFIDAYNDAIRHGSAIIVYHEQTQE